MKMKRLTHLFTFIAAALVLMLVSCDDDQQIAMQLQGKWRGQITADNYYYYSRRHYTDYERYATVFYFDGKLGSRHGTGWEIDYNPYSRSQRYSREKFEYWVSDEIITLEYRDGTRAEISDYRFVNDGGSTYFEGYIEDDSDREIRFRLMQDNDWDDSSYSYYY